MTAPVRFGYIGCGYIARHVHLPNLAEMAADPQIEAVGLSAPYALQGHIAEDFLRAGRHVFMENPWPSVPRAEAERAGGVRLMVGYPRSPLRALCS